MDEKIVKKTVDLYEGIGWKKFFIRIRLWDAPFAEIEKYVPKKGLILDLGCGEGIFANYLALASPKRKFIGLEIDEHRVADADRGVRNVKFRRGDVLQVAFPKADCILMTHLLHHLPSLVDQEKLIKKTFKSLNKGGLLVVTEVTRKPFLKYLVSWLTDAFIVPILFEKHFWNFNFYYRKKEDWIKLFKEIGFRVVSRSASKNKPFSHIIFIARLE